MFGKGTDEPSRPLLPPGTCWVCEQSPSQEVEKVIDTRRNSRAGGSISHESVRKYICESCATEHGKAVGMVTPEEFAELKKEKDDAQFEAIAMRERLEAAEAGQVKVVNADAVMASIGPVFANIHDAIARLEKPKKAASVPASDE